MEIPLLISNHQPPPKTLTLALHSLKIGSPVLLLASPRALGDATAGLSPLINPGPPLAAHLFRFLLLLPLPLAVWDCAPQRLFAGLQALVCWHGCGLCALASTGVCSFWVKTKQATLSQIQVLKGKMCPKPGSCTPSLRSAVFSTPLEAGFTIWPWLHLFVLV